MRTRDPQRAVLMFAHNDLTPAMYTTVVLVDMGRCGQVTTGGSGASGATPELRSNILEVVKK